MIERILRSSGSQGSLPDKLCIFVFPKIRCLLIQRSTSWGGRVWDKPQKPDRKFGIVFLHCSFGVFRKEADLYQRTSTTAFAKKLFMLLWILVASRNYPGPLGWIRSGRMGAFNKDRRIITTVSLFI